MPSLSTKLQGSNCMFLIFFSPPKQQVKCEELKHTFHTIVKMFWHWLDAKVAKYQVWSDTVVSPKTASAPTIPKRPAVGSTSVREFLFSEESKADLLWMMIFSSPCGEVAWGFTVTLNQRKWYLFLWQYKIILFFHLPCDN